ncbi:helicase-associated domain-containing protein [Actinotalea solisilvae]|uniref:helicase-associated domain-containing protein n=1 Tax=Actinotalea solisilvae TaxID=2072922 RepID=UPI0018F1FD03|nr:helicase-associated domain-containing protein [Actinotalea solisilvae]
MATFTEHLRARGEEGLAALLAERPDLAAPPPASLRALAARAANRVSLDRALGTVDAAVLHVLEAVLALHGTAGRGAVTLGDVVALGGADPDDAARAATAALRLALVWTPETRAGVPAPATPTTRLLPAPGLEDVLGPYPAGLGPTLRQALARRSPQGLARLVADLGLATEGAHAGHDAVLDAVAAHLADPPTVSALLDRAPSGARSVLEALTWGPPVGRSPVPPPGQEAGPGRTAVEWLLRHGLLSVGDPQHVVLPREVALVLRGNRTHREPPAAPDPTPGAVDVRTVDAESAQHALEVVRLVGVLLDAWGAEPPPVLRAGGLGTRELRRVATRLEVDDARAALVVEVAGAAGLVVDDGEEPASVAPTADADDWLRRPAPERWEQLVAAWFASERAAWLVGTRDDRGTVRPALDPEARRPWAPRLRRTVLEVLAGSTGPLGPPGPAGSTTLASLTAAQVHEVLAWRAPRSAPPLHAVEAVLAEATALGVLGGGALAPAGGALLGGDGTPARALADRLPPAVDDLLLQGDLTGIVPGRPSDALADLVESAAQVESRGAALTVRFTEASVRRALDRGRTAEELLAALSHAARNGVPQPLEYLVLDVARRHGRVRVGMASSYLRADDPALLAGLVEDKALRGLGLLLLAPTVIASQAAPSALLAALRERGLAPVTEDSTGAVVVVGPSVTRVRGRARRRSGGPTGPAGTPAVTADDARDRRLRRVAKDVLAADRREATAAVQAHDAEVIAARSGGPAGPAPADQGTPDPVLALALLREAVAEGREVWLDIVGPDGGSSRRRVRPVRVDAGRVRAIDPEREAELTVAVHRIAGVTPTGGDR